MHGELILARHLLLSAFHSKAKARFSVTLPLEQEQVKSGPQMSPAALSQLVKLLQG
jgi:hypothetical protein